MSPKDTEFKVCAECKACVSLAYGNINGRLWFCVDCLVKRPSRADVGLIELYYRYSTPYYGFIRLTKAIRDTLALSPIQFRLKKAMQKGIEKWKK